MNSTISKLFLFTLIAIFSIVNSGISKAEDFAFETIWIDERRSQRNAIQDCLNSEACSSVLTAAAAYVGVPPKAIQAARVASKLTTTPMGESTAFVYNPPQGFDFCSVHVKTNSVVPADGRRASQMSIGMFPWEVGIMTTTPRLQAGIGGSSWNGWFTFTYVRKGVNHGGKCKINPTRIVFRCKGSAAHGGNCGEHRF